MTAVLVVSGVRVDLRRRDFTKFKLGGQNAADAIVRSYICTYVYLCACARILLRWIRIPDSGTGYRYAIARDEPRALAGHATGDI